MAEKNIRLLGRCFIECELLLRTGLHIGGAGGALEIGGVDNPVIRDPLTQRPYLPGSSLKGKMRSLCEKQYNTVQNHQIGRDVMIHLCKSENEYANCPVCHVFGTTGDKPFALPTRLVVRDAFLDEKSVEKLEVARTDLPYTEVKWEASIDRVTAAATPRQVERVPAGVSFSPVQMVFSFYQEKDIDLLEVLFDAFALLEDDYLGGLGSRGGGQIAFKKLHLYARIAKNYSQVRELLSADGLSALESNANGVFGELKKLLKSEA